MNQQNLEIIKKIIEEFFEKTTLEIDIEFSLEKDQTISVNLMTEDPQILIGGRGQTLAEIQHLLRAILKRRAKEFFYLNVDIDNYKKKKNEYLKEMARSAADEAVLSQKEKQLAPMSAYERRIIHLELAERTDVVSGSIGQEPERKVVISPRKKS